MDHDLIQQQIRAERLALADFLDGLTAAEWERQSLCGGWNVHQVLAHLTLSTRDSLRGTLVDVIRARGNWDRANADAAIRRAAQFTPAELLTQLRESADCHRRSPGAGVLDPLVDIIVHGQDIARPLGRDYRTPPERVVAPLEYALKSVFYGARKRLRGTRLVATDTTFTHGTGPEEIQAPILDLLLLATGRPVTTDTRA
ncbi:maleylpyruvate isomerase family mycothiol-dependent enzyme [Nocardia sp. NPDC048505]|uniref:maleylpyruvate isomerase family mycothiol-dependent enzyme n=1 Tax=unclassified Nocardia TaxID=2637762 RepID=UPI0033D61DB1